MRIWPDKYFTQSLEPDTCLLSRRGLNQNIPAKFFLTRQITIFHSDFGAGNVIGAASILSKSNFEKFYQILIEKIIWVHTLESSPKIKLKSIPVQPRVKTRIRKKWFSSPHNNRAHVEDSLNAELVTCIKHAVVDMGIISIFSTAVITAWWGDGSFQISIVF